MEAKKIFPGGLAFSIAISKMDLIINVEEPFIVTLKFCSVSIYECQRVKNNRIQSGF